MNSRASHRFVPGALAALALGFSAPSYAAPPITETSSSAPETPSAATEAPATTNQNPPASDNIEPTRAADPVSTEESSPAPPEAPPVPDIDTTMFDAVLQGAAQDLGLAVHQLLPAQVLKNSDYLAWETQLARPAVGKVTLGALLVPQDERWQLRLVALNDKGFYYHTTASFDGSNAEVTTVRSLTQLTKQFTPPRAQPTARATGTLISESDSSEGKATLAAAGALFGGYLGFAVENVGGSADAALIYPLVALGSGVGMATALVAAEEWPVSRPRAWYISGGGFWLTAAAVLIAHEQDLAHPTDRYPFGLIGTAVGIGVASVVSSYREVREPQALLSNEGGAFGTLAGGLIQRLADPSSTELPALGMGIGGAVGWMAAGLIGPFGLPDLSSSRVLFAGLGGSVGALTGAAIASPAVVNSDRREPKKEGVLFASALGGLVLGSVVGYWFGEGDPPPTEIDAEVGTGRRQSRPLHANVPLIKPALSTTPEVRGASPYAVHLPSTTNLTLSGTW